MNDQTIDTITTPKPNQRQSFARLLAATCMVNYPHLRRPHIISVWAEMTLYAAHNREFGQMMLQAKIGGARRFAILVFEVWGYWLDRR